MWFTACRGWGITDKLHICTIKHCLLITPICHLKTDRFGELWKLCRIELHPICPLHGAFPSAFPAADGSLFQSLPVVAQFDKYIVTGGTWEGDSALKILKMTYLISQTGRENVGGESMNVCNCGLENNTLQQRSKHGSPNSCLNKLKSKILLYWSRCLEIRHGSAHYDLLIPFTQSHLWNTLKLYSQKRRFTFKAAVLFWVGLALISIKRGMWVHCIMWSDWHRGKVGGQPNERQLLMDGQQGQ